MLDPCPFCGGGAEIERLGSDRQSMIYVCTQCGARLETGETFISEHCSWNARSGSQGVVDDTMVSIAVAGFNAARGSPHHVHLIGNHFEYEQMRAALLAAMGGKGDGWIACSERMPELYQTVIAVMDVQGVPTVRALTLVEEPPMLARDMGKKRVPTWQGFGPVFYPEVERVYRWRPLPPPPTTISEERT